jgi:hypothetical protein
MDKTPCPHCGVRDSGYVDCPFLVVRQRCFYVIPKNKEEAAKKAGCRAQHYEELARQDKK